MYQKLSFEFAVLWNFSLSAIVSNRVTVLLELQRYVVEKKNILVYSQVSIWILQSVWKCLIFFLLKIGICKETFKKNFQYFTLPGNWVGFVCYKLNSIVFKDKLQIHLKEHQCVTPHTKHTSHPKHNGTFFFC